MTSPPVNRACNHDRHRLFRRPWKTLHALERFARHCRKGESGGREYRLIYLVGEVMHIVARKFRATLSAVFPRMEVCQKVNLYPSGSGTERDAAPAVTPRGVRRDSREKVWLVKVAAIYFFSTP